MGETVIVSTEDDADVVEPAAGELWTVDDPEVTAEFAVDAAMGETVMTCTAVLTVGSDEFEDVAEVVDAAAREVWVAEKLEAAAEVEVDDATGKTVTTCTVALIVGSDEFAEAPETMEVVDVATGLP